MTFEQKELSFTKQLKFMKIFSFLFIGILFTVASCKKLNPPEENDEPKERVLPPATTSGENTFGCKVNGEVFLPKGNLNYWGIDHPKYYEEEGRLWIRVKNIYDYHNRITMYVHIHEFFFSVGTFNNLIDSLLPNYRISYEDYTESSYFIDSTQEYFVQINRLDADKKIVSGQFEYTLFNDKLGDTLKITEGRFDLNNMIIQ